MLVSSTSGFSVRAHCCKPNQNFLNAKHVCFLRDEALTRKKIFNQMEDLKGKIRVYCRVRPMLKFELDKGQKMALKIPDELSLEFMQTKDKKREYSFDAVFAPGTSQDKVRCGGMLGMA